MTSIDALKELIARNRATYREHQGHIRGLELRTRIILIDPILCALGWDVADPSRVRLELRANGSEIDYVLVKDGRNHAVVEAKAAL